ncbi:MAG: hypothetical protein E7404_07910 [Ruminococcaceae bacterium]|nr:hypothetical protein [Oscillospiraceae bacterium]
MADHIVKFKEVPKGQRFQFFWDYYRIPTIVGIIVAVVVVSLIKTVFFTPDPDINILITTQYTFSDENLEEFNKQVELMLDDYNGDNKKISLATPIAYNEKISENDPQYAMAALTKFNVELASGLNIIQITDDEMYKRYEASECLANYKVFEEFGVKCPVDNKTEIVKIPLSEIEVFSNIKHADELYLTVRPPMVQHTKKDKDKEFYKANLNFIIKLIS